MARFGEGVTDTLQRRVVIAFNGGKTFKNSILICAQSRVKLVDYFGFKIAQYIYFSGKK